MPSNPIDICAVQHTDGGRNRFDRRHTDLPPAAPQSNPGNVVGSGQPAQLLVVVAKP